MVDLGMEVPFKDNTEVTLPCANPSNPGVCWILNRRIM